MPVDHAVEDLGLNLPNLTITYRVMPYIDETRFVQPYGGVEALMCC